MASAPLPLERRDWKNLPDELLDLIFRQLVLLPDCIRSSVVCKKWLSTGLRHKEKQNRVNPMLFIPTTNKDYRNLFDIWGNKVYNFQFPIPYREKCSGSSNGWWAVTETNMSITLINPFSGKTIHLPSIIDFSESYPDRYYFNRVGCKPEYLIFKVVLSCDPSSNSNDYVVAVIHHFCSNLAIFKSREQLWIHTDDFLGAVTDCQFYKGRLYVTNFNSQLIAIDYNDHTGISLEHVVTNVLNHDTWMNYLVETLDGNLLLIRRLYLNIEFDETVGFKIYELKTDSSKKNNGEWKEIDNVGNYALFVGSNQSICVDASSLSACKPNSIYYTDDTNKWGQYDPDFIPKDMGIFNLEKKQISRYYQISDPTLNMPAAVWILPTWS